MNKYVSSLALAALMSFSAIASTTDSLLIGGFAGLTAGFLSSAISQHSPHRHCRRHACHSCRPKRNKTRVVHTQPVIIKQPVVLQETPIRIASLTERELALKEQQLKLELLKEENRKKELQLREKELLLRDNLLITT